MNDDYNVKEQKVPTMAEMKVEDIGQTLSRIETALSSILMPSQPLFPEPTTSALTAAKPASKLITDLNAILEFAHDIEKRINF